MSNVLKAILNDFAERDVTTPVSKADLNLAQVLLDQLYLAPREPDYLPYGTSPKVNQILEELRNNPGAVPAPTDLPATSVAVTRYSSTA